MRQFENLKMKTAIALGFMLCTFGLQAQVQYDHATLNALKLAGKNVTAISNDTAANSKDSAKLITEYAAKKYADNNKTDTTYLHEQLMQKVGKDTLNSFIDTAKYKADSTVTAAAIARRWNIGGNSGTNGSGIGTLDGATLQFLQNGKNAGFVTATTTALGSGASGQSGGIAIGVNAGGTGYTGGNGNCISIGNNTAIQYNSYDILIGHNNNTTGGNNILIGNNIGDNRNSALNIGKAIYGNNIYSNNAAHIGINTSVDAGYALDVLGTNRVQGALTVQDGTQGAGKILTSDSSGKASWQTPAASGSTTLAGLTDVALSSPASGQLLQYSGSKWQNFTPNYLTSYTETDPIFNAHTVHNISNGTGLLRNNGSGSWSYDNSSYLTSNQPITLAGDVTGSGTTAIATTLANTGVAAGTYNSVTVNAKGLVTAGANAASGWSLTGNAGLTADNFIGTNAASGVANLNFRVYGSQAGLISDVNSQVVYLGINTPKNGYSSVGIGTNVLSNTTVATSNTAVGNTALNGISTGSYNTAIGGSALGSLNTGNYNTALGYVVGLTATGSYNTFIGAQVKPSNTTVSNMVLIGDGSGNQRIQIPSSGNTLLGYANNQADAGYKLDVNGTARIAGQLTLPTGANSGYVLTSDGSGNASWQAPASVPVISSGTFNPLFSSSSPYYNSRLSNIVSTYTRAGNVIHGSANIFLASGSPSGTVQLYINLPVGYTTDNNNTSLGSGTVAYAYNSSGQSTSAFAVKVTSGYAFATGTIMLDPNMSMEIVVQFDYTLPQQAQ